MVGKATEHIIGGQRHFVCYEIQVQTDDDHDVNSDPPLPGRPVRNAHLSAFWLSVNF